MAEVVVVGAGIVGAAVAYESARAGAAVTLIDKALPASGVTGDSFAWVGGPRGGDLPDASTPLRRRVLDEYRRLESEVPGVRVRWTGSLSWGHEDPARRRQLGPDERWLGAQDVRRLEPNLTTPPHRALHKAGDGAVDPVAATQALVGAARQHGARLEVGVAVTALHLRNGRVTGVRTSKGFRACSSVVIAAGVDAPLLCAPLGVDVPVAPSPALLLRFTAPPGLVRTLVATADLEVRQAPDGELLVAASHRGEAGPDDLVRTGREAAERLAAAFAGGEHARLRSVRLGARPMPADGLPIVGPLPGAGGVYLAAMHSGVTLAPVVGRLVAAELVDGALADELDGLRPARSSTRLASGPPGQVSRSPAAQR